VRVDLVSGTQAAVTSQAGTLQTGDAIVIANGSHSRSPRTSAAGTPLNLGGGSGFARGVH
jgi:hypothetical protein